MQNNEVVFQKVIAKLGSQTKLARRMGVTSPAVFKWKTRGIPAVHVLEIEQLTEISRHELRPDIFGSRPPRKKQARKVK